MDNMSTNVLAIGLRVAAWALIPRESIFTLRVGMASEEEDMEYVSDIVEGRYTDQWLLLWYIVKCLGRMSVFAIPAMCILIDLAIGYLLKNKNAPYITAVWLLNPITVASNAISIANVHVLLTIGAVVLFSSKSKSNKRLAGFIIAFAAYLNPTTAAVLATIMVYLEPTCLLSFSVTYVLVVLLGISMGDHLYSLSPFQCIMGRVNWGLHWYAYLEVFTSFRDVFCYLLVLFTPGTVLPYAYKLLSEKNTQCITLSMAYSLCVITSLRPTFVEYVGCALLAYWASPEAVQELHRSKLIYAWSLGLCFSLGNFFIDAWLRYQSANANFYYFVTLAWGITLTSLVFEHCTAHVLMTRSNHTE